MWWFRRGCESSASCAVSSAAILVATTILCPHVLMSSNPLSVGFPPSSLPLFHPLNLNLSKAGISGGVFKPKYVSFHEVISASGAFSGISRHGSFSLYYIDPRNTFKLTPKLKGMVLFPTPFFYSIAGTFYQTRLPLVTKWKIFPLVPKRRGTYPKIINRNKYLK